MPVFLLRSMSGCRESKGRKPHAVHRILCHPTTSQKKFLTQLTLGKEFSLSGCRESNPGYMTPSHAYYHYTTARFFICKKVPPNS